MVLRKCFSKKLRKIMKMYIQGRNLMNIRKQQELQDFWEYEHSFDAEDGAVSIDEDITFEESQHHLQLELEHINQVELEHELHPFQDDDIQPEDEHPHKTMLKRDIRAQALKRLEDAARTVSDFEEVISQWNHLDDNRERKERYHEVGRENIDSKKDMAPLAIVIPAPINHSYWRQLMKGDFIDIISNCPYEMHESLSDEDYSKIIYDLKDDHKELIYFLYLRDFTTNQLAALRNQSDRNIRGIRSTILGQIEKRVLMILVDRQGEDCPFTMEELDFLLRHEEEIPATMEKLALLKEIGVVVRRITREQKKQAKKRSEETQKNNRSKCKKEVQKRIQTCYDSNSFYAERNYYEEYLSEIQFQLGEI